MNLNVYLEQVTPKTYPDVTLATQLLTDSTVDREALRAAADRVNGAINGPRVTYIVNRNLNFTDVCVMECEFCGFSHSPGAVEATTYTPEQVVERLAETPNVSEFCMQGGINPDLDYEYYRSLLRCVHQAFPSVHIHAFSPQEIHHMTGLTGMSPPEVLRDLMACGLGSIAGTAAEILDDDVRRQICPRKIDVARWEEIVRAAHGLGMRFPATIMMGHIETPRQQAAHLDVLRRIQRDTGGFTELIPLPFVPYCTRLGRKREIAEMLPMSYLRRFYAVCRLFFGDRLEGLQVSWVKLGLDNAIELLDWGVSDFGGTLYEENITRSAGGRHGVSLGIAQIRAAIERVGRIPVRRDTQYRLYETPAPDPSDAVSSASTTIG
jgi:FO synthase